MRSVTQIPPSTTGLRAFEATARNHSFTAAAGELGLTQGAISHQVKELEKRLCVKLFKREAKGIVLTDEGTTYLAYVREALDRLRAGADALQPVRADNILTVSCSPNFAAKWMVPRLGAFLADHPELDLRISAGKQHVLFENDGIDLAVRHGHGDWVNLHSTRLCREEIFPVCSPYLLSSGKRLQSIGNLKRLTLLHDQNRNAWKNWLEQTGHTVEGFDFEHGPIYSETSLVIDAAVAGQGVALARSALAAIDLAEGRIVQPVSDSLTAEFAYWVVCPKPLAQIRKIHLFRQWLVAQANASSA